MEILSQFVVVTVMGICLASGYIIKHSLSFIPNHYIPLILGLLGVIVNFWLCNWQLTPAILLQGLASGLASTGAFELAKNLKNQIENQ